MTYTRSDINTILVTNDKAVERAMVRLFELQNADEQFQGTANEQNGRGFCSSDALVGTRFARWIQGRWVSYGQSTQDRIEAQRATSDHRK